MSDRLRYSNFCISLTADLRTPFVYDGNSIELFARVVPHNTFERSFVHRTIFVRLTEMYRHTDWKEHRLAVEERLQNNSPLPVL